MAESKDQSWDGTERRSVDAHIALLSNKVDNLHQDFFEMRGVLKELADAITKLALVEERQSQFAAAQERAFNVLERLEGRVIALEQMMPEAKAVHMWVVRGMWALAAASVIFIANKVGLITP